MGDGGVGGKRETCNVDRRLRSGLLHAGIVSRSGGKLHEWRSLWISDDCTLGLDVCLESEIERKMASFGVVFEIDWR